MNEEIRTFIAIPLPFQIRLIVSEIIKELKITLLPATIKWVSVENVHITLQFLGNQTKTTVAEISKKLAAGFYPSQFSANLGNIGAFPSLDNTRVIWIGLNPHENFKTLYEIIQNMNRFAIKDENQGKFSPHITIGRIKPGVFDQSKIIKQTLSKYKMVNSIPFFIDHFIIYQSVLTTKGPIYTELKRFYLPKK